MLCGCACSTRLRAGKPTDTDTIAPSPSHDARVSRHVVETDDATRARYLSSLATYSAFEECLRPERAQWLDRLLIGPGITPHDAGSQHVVDLSVPSENMRAACHIAHLFWTHPAANVAPVVEQYLTRLSWCVSGGGPWGRRRCGHSHAVCTNAGRAAWRWTPRPNRTRRACSATTLLRASMGCGPARCASSRHVSRVCIHRMHSAHLMDLIRFTWRLDTVERTRGGSLVGTDASGHVRCVMVSVAAELGGTKERGTA